MMDAPPPKKKRKLEVCYDSEYHVWCTVSVQEKDTVGDVINHLRAEKYVASKDVSLATQHAIDAPVSNSW